MRRPGDDVMPPPV